MTLNNKLLIETLTKMKKIYLKDPEKAVRSKKFITEFQNYCALEIKNRIKHKKIKTTTEVDIYTSFSKKKVDVVSLMENNGPMIMISVKSQMSSAMKNFIHYFEGVIGDVNLLHERFPFLTAGMIWLFPLTPIKKGKQTETQNFKKYEKAFTTATNRKNPDDKYSKYEHFCMLVVDFEKNPPKIITAIPKYRDLKINHFFDNLFDTFEKRMP
jgi:hypothetical protein